MRSAHFRAVDGLPCYTASSFPRAQAQLVTSGVDEDGYEAIKFALDNVPFRDSPFIAKNILLITDEGRSMIPEAVGVTRDTVQQSITVCVCVSSSVSTNPIGQLESSQSHSALQYSPQDS